MERQHNARAFSLTRRHLLMRTTALIGAVAVPAAFGTRIAWAQDPPNSCPAPPSGGTPFKLGDDTRPIVRRKALSSLSTPELNELAKAFAALASGSSTVPTSATIPQADLHALYCDQCTNDATNIHGSWNFLPWHRAYLYYMERILGAFVGDLPGFRLPYWDWESLRTLPAQYLQPNSATNPLWDALRNANLAAGKTLPAGDGTPARITTLDGITDFDTFGGTATSAGALEDNPHNTIHGDTGEMASPWRDMGNLGFAARDPVFFAHHCNIDKLWSRWNRIQGGPPGSHANPTDPGFLGARWSFYDETGAVVSISASDVLDHENALRYTYEFPLIHIPQFEYVLPCELIYHGPGPDPGPELAISETSVENIISNSRAGRAIVLVLTGVEIPGNAFGRFGIEAVRGEQRANIGSVSLLAAGAHHHHGETRTLVLDVTQDARLLFAQPRGAALRITSQGRERPFALRVKRAEIRITRESKPAAK